jgi:predicted aspartyl protease
MRSGARGGKMRTIKGLLVLLTVSGSLLLAEEKQEVSFQLIRDYVIVVKGSIGGQSNLHFIVDTGAVPSVFDKRLMKHLKALRRENLSVLSKSMDLTLAEAPNLRVGPWQQPALQVLVSDLSFASEALGVRIDGMLGLDFFGSSFGIDYREKKLHKLTNGYQVLKDELVIYHSPEAWYATVEMTFAGRTLQLLADSGTSDVVLFKPRVQDCIGKMKTVGQTTWSNMGGELAMQRVRLEGASIAGRPWSDREALVMKTSKGPQELDGLLGLGSVRAQRVVFLPPTFNAQANFSQGVARP